MIGLYGHSCQTISDFEQAERVYDPCAEAFSSLCSYWSLIKPTTAGKLISSFCPSLASIFLVETFRLVHLICIADLQLQLLYLYQISDFRRAGPVIPLLPLQS